MEDLKNKKLLIIVESPTKAKEISHILKNAGYKQAVVTASKGHIMKLADKKDSYKNTGIYPANEFDLNLEIDPDHAGLVSQLKEQVKVAEKVILMTDPDREGFVISWSLAKFLKLKKGTYSRAITHEIKPKAVIAAIENAVDMNLDLVDAGLTRMTIDKMVGYGLTPEARLYLGVKSVGRCQSVGLKIVVDREDEIQNFKPETYYDLYLKFSKNNTEFKAKYDSDRITDKDIINQVKRECTGPYVISDIQRREKQESPKPPFCTATFQQEAASKLGLGVKDAISIAQKLFEEGKISYHRTDDTELSDEFIPDLKAYIEKAYGKYVEPRKAKHSANDQNGHEALRVIDPNLTPDQFKATTTHELHYKVYKLIWQRTIASALPNAVISETKYIINNNKHNFILVSNELVDPGYRKVYNYKDDEAKEEGLIKETFAKNEVLQNCVLEDITKTTNPPARFTEASLVQKLKDLGVGRPSTYATIVDTVLSQTRGYAELQDKKIVPTQRGIQLAKYLDRAFPNLINLNYTKEMEDQLDLIATGKMKKIDYLNGFYNILEESINKNKEPKAIKADQEGKICPECGNPLVLRRSRYGTMFYGCSNYPACRHCEKAN